MKREEIKIDDDLYKQWLEGKTVELDQLESEDKSPEEKRKAIEDRIIELEKMIFFKKREVSLLHERRQKIVGASWKSNSESISDPNFTVVLDVDKVKKEFKPKAEKGATGKAALDAVGINPLALMKKLAEIKKKKEKEAEAKASQESK